ncbi:MAG: hypothetical protein AAGI69_23695 [Cyanobacteria bacterium P01_H01_bin.21]
MTQQLYPPTTLRPTARRTRKKTVQPLIPRASRWWRRSYSLAAGWGLAAISLLFNVSFYFNTPIAGDTKESCQTIVQSSAVLSREQLTKILAVPERSSQQSVKDIVAEPYCQLSDIELRDGVTAKREAYPLAFSPTTWLVMLYESDEYAGFAFSFQ